MSARKILGRLFLASLVLVPTTAVAVHEGVVRFTGDVPAPSGDQPASEAVATNDSRSPASSNLDENGKMPYLVVWGAMKQQPGAMNKALSELDRIESVTVTRDEPSRVTQYVLQGFRVDKSGAPTRRSTVTITQKGSVGGPFVYEVQTESAPLESDAAHH